MSSDQTAIMYRWHSLRVWVAGLLALAALVLLIILNFIGAGLLAIIAASTAAFGVRGTNRHYKINRAICAVSIVVVAASIVMALFLLATGTEVSVVDVHTSTETS